MDSIRFMQSRFWRWYQSHKMLSVDEEQARRREALGILVECVNSGEITTLDGIDTPLSCRIKASLGVSKFEMNRNWVGSAQDWVCPCCGRSKFDISRVGKHGQILAKLVVHHDHMTDVLKAAFHRAFERHGSTKAQVDGRKLVDRMAPAFAAYEEILICEDCNNADVEAKKLFAAPDYFSFSIGQIGRFIDPKPHAPHEIKSSEVVREWAEAKSAFELRMKLIEAVASAAVTDSHWYEPYARGAIAVPVLGEGFRHGDVEIQEAVPLTELFLALGPKEKTSVPDRSRWRLEVRKKGKPLPSNFLAMLRSKEDRAQAWDSLAPDWCCPICHRSKEEAVYVGNSGQMKFYPMVIGKHPLWASVAHTCNHCESVLMSLKWEATAVSGVTPSDSCGFVTPEELSCIIIARPHSKHAIDLEKAEVLLSVVVNRLLNGNY